MSDSKQNIVAIVQARMGSTRLPGKILMDIKGKTMLERVIERLGRAELIDEIVIATTSDIADDKTVEIATKMGVPSYRGSEENVLERYYQSAAKYKADHIVRVTSDCPLIDPEIVDRVIKKHISTAADYTTNIIERTFPRGFDVEVFKYDSFEVVREKAREQHQIEHVTPYFREHPEVFKLENIQAVGAQRRPDLRLCVDEKDDLMLIKKIYEETENVEKALAKDIIKLIDSDPGLKEINSKIRQKNP